MAHETIQVMVWNGQKGFSRVVLSQFLKNFHHEFKVVAVQQGRIELDIDQNFYNLLVITIGLFLCGIVTGLV